MNSALDRKWPSRLWISRKEREILRECELLNECILQASALIKPMLDDESEELNSAAYSVLLELVNVGTSICAGPLMIGPIVVVRGEPYWKSKPLLSEFALAHLHSLSPGVQELVARAFYLDANIRRMYEQKDE